MQLLINELQVNCFFSEREKKNKLFSFKELITFTIMSSEAPIFEIISIISLILMSCKPILALLYRNFKIYNLSNWFLLEPKWESKMLNASALVSL